MNFWRSVSISTTFVFAGPACGPSSEHGTSVGPSSPTTDGSTPVYVPPTCNKLGMGGDSTIPLAAAAKLMQGKWINIAVPGTHFEDGANTQGMAVDSCHPATLYLTAPDLDLGAAGGGLFKTTDAGLSWKQIGAVTSENKNTMIDTPIRVRIDPADSQHLYLVDGVWGNTKGFWVSVDGGETFTHPQGYYDIQKDTGNGPAWDTYDVAADPSDFKHVLVSLHSGWVGDDAGILESKDGEDHWIVHPPIPGWGHGHAINFLYKPELNIGDSETWLLGTQSDGLWRRTLVDGKETWTDLKTQGGIQHGGGTIYYDKAGILYAGGSPNNWRSTDNGEHWTAIDGASGGANAIFGDGHTLYTAKCFGPVRFSTSPEGDGINWTTSDSPSFSSGPFEMAMDSANGIVYSANWGAGLWALKL